MLQQYLPFTVLKLATIDSMSLRIATTLQQYLPFTVLKRNYLCYIFLLSVALQQYLPFTVCDEGGEAAEEQSDDEVCTSLVPDQREGKTKVMVE